MMCLPRTRRNNFTSSPVERPMGTWSQARCGLHRAVRRSEFLRSEGAGASLEIRFLEGAWNNKADWVVEHQQMPTCLLTPASWRLATAKTSQNSKKDTEQIM